MSKPVADPLSAVSSTAAVRAAARALVEAVQRAVAEAPLSAEGYAQAMQEIAELRGRPLFLPIVISGLGEGARLRLADGRTILDFIGGIGVYAFGHSERDLLETAVIAAARDVVFQGNLAPGLEQSKLSRLLLSHASPRLAHAWLSVSGAMANENAIKMIWQKHHPAQFIVAFENSFAGRTTTMAEVTDKPSFREGLPLRGNVLYVPFFDPRIEGGTQRSLAALDTHIKRYPGQIAGMLFELVQGEGGFNTAPREFFMALMERCREAKIAVWVDEVQTYARTGELFAHQTLGLGDYVDLVTVGKILQGSAVLYTKEYNPREGLVAGTYAGATVGLAVGARIIEKLAAEGYLGANGRVAGIARRVAARFDAIALRMPRAIGARSGIGAMQAFVPFDGAPATTNAIIKAAFEEGVLVFGAGKDPMKIRMLLPVNVTDEELDAGFAALEKALQRVAAEKGLAC
ncbi:MAG TPA: aminotransferase class III-fold pyridoxal phosphate-dependent enzyme [Myxococcota bacterium]